MRQLLRHVCKASPWPLPVLRKEVPMKANPDDYRNIGKHTYYMAVFIVSLMIGFACGTLAVLVLR